MKIKMSFEIAGWGYIAHNDKDEDNLELCASYIEDQLKEIYFDEEDIDNIKIEIIEK